MRFEHPDRSEYQTSQRLDGESMPQVMETGTTVGGGQAQSI